MNEIYDVYKQGLPQRQVKILGKKFRNEGKILKMGKIIKLVKVK